MKVDLEQVISKKKIKAYHEDFERVKKSPFRQRLLFPRMHLNRTIQSSRIILQNPNIWRRALKGFLKSRHEENVSLRSLELAVTYRCNSACEQCSCRLSFDKEREKTEKLTTEEYKNAVDQAVEMGAFQFCINGGEPLLEEKMAYDLTEYIKKHHNCYVHLCTNGILLTEEKLLKFKDLGLDSLEMGFDSAFESIHDENRQKGSYANILKTVRLGKKHNIKVVLNTILTNEKVQSDDIIYTFLLAKKLGCLLQITPCCLTGAYKNRLDIMMTPVTKLYFHWLLSKSSNNRSDLYSSLTTIKCPAAREKIGLQPYGDVVSCPLIQIRYGNIRDKSLRDIQKEMLKNPYYHGKEAECCLPAMSEGFIREYLVDK